MNALAGVIGVGITYIKDDEDILPILKVSLDPLSIPLTLLITGTKNP